MKVKETIYESPQMEVVEILLEQSVLTISLTGEPVDPFEKM